MHTKHAITAPNPSQKMQKIVAALALSGASALVAPAAPRATVKVQETKADLERLCAENPTALPFEGIWDPLGCADFNFWGLGNEATIGYLRHAEIKHGRIAMAGFLGFFVQSPGNFIGDIVSGDHAILPYRGYVAGCTPQEQWANIPMIGKLQILTAVGMLESYGEGAGYPASYTYYTGAASRATTRPSRARAARSSKSTRPLRPARLRLPRHVRTREGLFADQRRPSAVGLVPCRNQIRAPHAMLSPELHHHWLIPTGLFSVLAGRSRARTRSTKSSTSTCRRATSTSWARSSPSSPRPSR